MKIFNTLIKTAAIAAVLIFTGCEKEKEQSLSDLGKRLCGEWKLEIPAEINVYLAFAADMTFEEYQKLDDGNFKLRRGTWTLAENLLSGKYNDGTEWSSTYTILIADKVLMMISSNEDAFEYQYVQKVIPQVVKESCEVAVKSGGMF